MVPTQCFVCEIESEVEKEVNRLKQTVIISYYNINFLMNAVKKQFFAILKKKMIRRKCFHEVKFLKIFLPLKGG